MKPSAEVLQNLFVVLYEIYVNSPIGPSLSASDVPEQTTLTSPDPLGHRSSRADVDSRDLGPPPKRDEMVENFIDVFVGQIRMEKTQSTARSAFPC